MKNLMYIYIPIGLFYMVFNIFFIFNLFKSGKTVRGGYLSNVKYQASNGILVSKILLVLHYVISFLAFVFLVLMFLHIK